MTELEDLASQLSIELEEGIRLSTKLRLRAKSSGDESLFVVINLLQFFQISLFDLVILMESMENVSGWKYKLFVRQFYLTTYESIEDLQHLLGREFRDAVTAIDADETTLEIFSDIGKSLNHIKKKYKRSLHNVRHYISAHRDHDAEKQLEFINSISSQETDNLQYDLFSWCLKFLKGINLIMELVTNKVKNA